MLWCPSEVEDYYGSWIMVPPYFDPRWPGIINTGANSMILYSRLAANKSVSDWTHSGNSQIDGPPTKPGMADDAIVTDRHYREYNDTLETHHGYYGAYDTSPYKESCIGYGDGHGETHHHHIDFSLPFPSWDGEYVPSSIQYFLY